MYLSPKTRSWPGVVGLSGPLLSQARADCEGRVQKAKMDEAALLRAVQELRAKIMDDEKELSVVCEHIKVRVGGKVREVLP